jgi:hypothetical protein
MANKFAWLSSEVERFEGLVTSASKCTEEEGHELLGALTKANDAMARFVDRAKETDEDKKIYGPKMCAKVR